MCVQCVGMCSYCDCRSLPVISRLSLEHAAILKLAAEVRDAVGAGEDGGQLLDRLLGMLVEHGSYEERSLYHELRCDTAFADAVGDLCSEHGAIYGALRRARRGMRREVLLPALERLRQHIMKEEQGLFPPAVILLSASAWERAAARA